MQAKQAAQKFNEANAAFREQRWADALALAEKALALNAGLVVGHVLQARCLVRLDKPEAARDAFAAALRLDPKQFSAWLELGNVSRRLGAMERAVQCYERAAACNPQDGRGYMACARALEEMPDAQAQDRAAVYFQKALTLADGDVKSRWMCTTPWAGSGWTRVRPRVRWRPCGQLCSRCGRTPISFLSMRSARC